MKKITTACLATLLLVSLASCSPKSDTSTQTTSSVNKVSEKKVTTNHPTGQEAYQSVLDRYRAYSTAIEAGDRTTLETALKQIESTSDEYSYIFNLQTLGTKATLSYVFMDLDKDGKDELVLGDGQSVSAIYYLKNQKPTLLHTAFVASAGGFRSSLQLFDDGSVIYATFSSLNPEMDLTHYKFQKGGLEVLKEAQIRIGANQKAEQVLGISAKELDPSRFKWKELGEEKNSTSKVSSKEETSTSFQVQVSVLDLRIRKEPTVKGQEVGKISKGIHTITETRSADGYTWGKLESGQGWIALEFTTKLDGKNASALDGLSVEDQEDIRSVVQNGYSLSFSRLVRPTMILELANEHSGIYAYSQSMFLDYYNTYTPDTYQLADVIKKLEAKETSESIQSMSEEQLIQLASEKKQAWLYSSKDKMFFELVPGGRGGAAPEMEIPSANEWVVEGDTVVVTTRIKSTSQPMERYVLKRNQKKYSGGEHKTRFYVVSKEFVN